MLVDANRVLPLQELLQKREKVAKGKSPTSYTLGTLAPIYQCDEVLLFSYQGMH